MERISRGPLLALAGVILVLATMGAGAALAPSLDAGAESGKTLVGSQAWGARWHEAGRVYMLNDTEMAWTEDAADSYFEVERAADGTVLAAFADRGRLDCEGGTPCTRTGFQRIDPGNGVVGEYSFPVRSITNSEVHAIDPLPDGSVALTDMEHERVAVVENGSVVWEWHASSFYTPPDDPSKRDWLHINDVEYVGSDRFLVSVRNANQLLVVERGDGVVEVINEDRSDADDEACLGSRQLVPDESGDVRCGDPDVLDHQHNPQWLGDGAVLVADSSNDRVVELHRQNGTWQPAWALYEAGNVRFHWPRDADRLPNGNTLITDTINGRLVEVDANGTLVWSMSTARTPYEGDRLPVGESVGAPIHGDPGEAIEGPEDGIALLSTVTFAAHAAFPALPFWIGELQVLSVVVGAVLVLVGAVDWVWQRLRD